VGEGSNFVFWEVGRYGTQNDGLDEADTMGREGGTAGREGRERGTEGREEREGGRSLIIAYLNSYCFENRSARP